MCDALRVTVCTWLASRRDVLLCMCLCVRLFVLLVDVVYVCLRVRVCVYVYMYMCVHHVACHHVRSCVCMVDLMGSWYHMRLIGCVYACACDDMNSWLRVCEYVCLRSRSRDCCMVWLFTCIGEHAYLGVYVFIRENASNMCWWLSKGLDITRH